MLLKRMLSLAIVLSFLLCAFPALAAPATKAADPDIKEISKNCEIYEKPDALSKAIAKVSKGEIVLAHEKEGKYTKIHIGKTMGYVSTGNLKSVSSSAIVRSVGQTNAATNVYAGASTSSTVLAKLAKDEFVSMLTEIGEYVVIRQGKLIGLAAQRSVTAFNSKSTVVGYIYLTKAATLKNGPASSDKTLAKASKGEILPYYRIYGGQLIVSRGSATGIIPSSGVNLYDFKSAAIGTAKTIADANIYAGPGSKYTKLGSVKAKNTVDVLARLGSYTIIRYGNIIGQVSSSSLDFESAEKDDRITTKYVEITANTKVLDGAKSSAADIGNIKKGSIVENLGADIGNTFIKIKSGDLVGYVLRKYVKATTKVPAK